MPLIIKGNKDIEVISKKEMTKFIEKAAAAKADPLNSLPPEVAAKRREILEIKESRKYLAKVQREKEEHDRLVKEKLEQATAEIEKLTEAKVQATEELVVTTTVEPIVIDTKDTHVATIQLGPDVPDFMSMTKKEIDNWAEENVGVQLDRRHTKAKMIEELTKHL